MARSMYSMRLAADRRVSAGARFHAEREEQTQRQGRLSRRLGPVFAEMAAQAANAQQGPKSSQHGVENPNPMPAPAKAYKPAHGGYPGTPVLRNPQPLC